MSIPSISLQSISDVIEVIPNYPKKGIYFRNIAPLLKNHKLREKAFDMLTGLVLKYQIDSIAGIESRGFVFGTALANKLACGFIMIKKQSDPQNPSRITLNLQDNSVKEGENILVVDDILATGGSLSAGCELIKKSGGNVVGVACLIELIDIVKNKKLHDHKIFSLIKYPAYGTDKHISKSDEMLFYPLVEYKHVQGKEKIVKVFIASENKLKLKSSYTAVDKILKLLDEKNYKILVFGVDTPSEVNEKPINDEIKNGCNNRMKNLKKYIDNYDYDYDFLISIQNGRINMDDNNLMPKGSKIHDHCEIQMIYNENTYSTQSDDTTSFSDKFFVKSLDLIKVIDPYFTITIQDTFEECGLGNPLNGFSNKFDPIFDKCQKMAMMINSILKSFKPIYL